MKLMSTAGQKMFDFSQGLRITDHFANSITLNWALTMQNAIHPTVS